MPKGASSSYTQAQADEICRRLSEGEPLAEICRSPRMPSRQTVNQWRRSNEEFAAAYTVARDEGYDCLAEECLKIANTPQMGLETTSKAGGVTEIKEADMLGHRKLQIDTRLKLLAKWDPKRYGERLQVDPGDEPQKIIIETNMTSD